MQYCTHLSTLVKRRLQTICAIDELLRLHQARDDRRFVTILPVQSLSVSWCDCRWQMLQLLRNKLHNWPLLEVYPSVCFEQNAELS